MTGTQALKCLQQTFGTVKKLSEEFKVKNEEVILAVAKLQQQAFALQDQVKQARKQLLIARVPELVSSIVQVGQTPFCYAECEGLVMDDLRQLCQDVEKKAPGFYVFVNKDAQGDRITILGYLAKGYEAKVDLKKFLTLLHEKFGIKGGGSSSLVQGGANSLPDVLKHEIEVWLATH